MTFDLFLAWRNLRYKDLHYKFLNSILFPRSDTYRAVKLMNVSTKPTPPEQLRRFWCICITRSTSDIIREMRNKGALHRWNEASAVRRINQLCLVWVSASSQFYQSWEKLYERKPIKTFFYSAWDKNLKKSKQKKERKKRCSSWGSRRTDNEIEGGVLI